MASLPSIPSKTCRAAPSDWQGTAGYGRSREIGPKELSRIFGLCDRQIRRLQNTGHLIEPVRRSGSVRIQYYPPEEIARFAAARFRRGKGFDKKEAAALGWLEFLERVETEVRVQGVAFDPERHAEVRIQLMLELVIFRAESPLAQRIGLTPTEINQQIFAAEGTLRELLREMPTCTQRLSEVVQDGLIALGIVKAEKRHIHDRAPAILNGRVRQCEDA